MTASQDIPPIVVPFVSDRAKQLLDKVCENTADGASKGQFVRREMVAIYHAIHSPRRIPLHSQNTNTFNKPVYAKLLTQLSFLRSLGREVRRRGSHSRRPSVQCTDWDRGGTMAWPSEHHGRFEEEGACGRHLEHVSAQEPLQRRTPVHQRRVWSHGRAVGQEYHCERGMCHSIYGRKYRSTDCVLGIADLKAKWMLIKNTVI